MAAISDPNDRGLRGLVGDFLGGLVTRDPGYGAAVQRGYATTRQNQLQLEQQAKRDAIAQRVAALNARSTIHNMALADTEEARAVKSDALTAALNRQAFASNAFSLGQQQTNAPLQADLLRAQLGNELAQGTHAGALTKLIEAQARAQELENAPAEELYNQHVTDLARGRLAAAQAEAAHKAAAFDVLPEVEGIVADKEAQLGIRLPQIVRSNAASFAATHLSRGVEPDKVFAGLNSMLDRELAKITARPQPQDVSGADPYDFGPVPEGLYRTTQLPSPAPPGEIGGLVGAGIDIATATPQAFHDVTDFARDLLRPAAFSLPVLGAIGQYPFVGAASGLSEKYDKMVEAAHRAGRRLGFVEAAGAHR